MSLTTVVDPTVMRAEARIGRTLREKWRLDRLLGVGGMASVYSGTHRNGSRGAIKMLHLELSLDPDIKARFLREGYLANAVDHPGVVRVIDDDVAEDGSVFIVMELLSGETLDARWERKGQRLSVVEVLSAMDPLLDVLAAAHERGIVHRDVKPENVFVTHDGVVKLLDFGIARLREGAQSATRSGSTMGTPAFMPPEQALGRSNEVGPGSDIWAVGAMMFTLLSGRFVHERQTANETLVAAATQPAPPLTSVLPGVAPAVASLIDTALAFESARRWPNARGMQDALRSTYHATQGSPVQTAPRLDVPSRGTSLPDGELLRPATGTTGAAGAAGGSVAQEKRGPPPTVVVASLGVAAGAIVIAGVSIVALVARPGATPSPTSADTRAADDVPTRSSSTALDARPPPPTAGGPTVLPVDALPPTPETGRIAVSAPGGSCSVSVGTQTFGVTPVDIELPPGAHKIQCAGTEGTQTRRIEVRAGAADAIAFPISKPASRAAPVSIDPLDRRRTTR